MPCGCRKNKQAGAQGAQTKGCTGPNCAQTNNVNTKINAKQGQVKPATKVN